MYTLDEVIRKYCFFESLHFLFFIRGLRVFFLFLISISNFEIYPQLFFPTKCTSSKAAGTRTTVSYDYDVAAFELVHLVRSRPTSCYF